jgi:hypothetical protein
VIIACAWEACAPYTNAVGIPQLRLRIMRNWSDLLAVRPRKSAHRCCRPELALVDRTSARNRLALVAVRLGSDNASIRELQSVQAATVPLQDKPQESPQGAEVKVDDRCGIPFDYCIAFDRDRSSTNKVLIAALLTRYSGF